jgi:hypothetical protein
MKNYAHVRDGVVFEIVSFEDDVLLEDRYNALLLNEFVPMQENEVGVVQQGWFYDGSGFASPPEPPPPSTEHSILMQQQAAIDEDGSVTIPINWVVLRLVMRDQWIAVANNIAANPPLMLRLIFENLPIRADDEEIIDLLRVSGANPDEILAEIK